MAPVPVNLYSFCSVALGEDDTEIKRNAHGFAKINNVTVLTVNTVMTDIYVNKDVSVEVSHNPCCSPPEGGNG